jgi:Peroxidase
MTMKYHHSYSGLLAISCSILSRVTLTNSFVPSTSSSSIVAVATQHPFSSLARRTKTNTDIRLQMSSSATSLAMDTIQGAQSMIDAIIDEKNCNPVLVRLAWHDSGTYDVNLQD